jgi:hypothetical protein
MKTGTSVRLHCRITGTAGRREWNSKHRQTARSMAIGDQVCASQAAQQLLCCIQKYKGTVRRRIVEWVGDLQIINLNGIGGSGRDLFWGNVVLFAWRNWGQSRKHSVTVVYFQWVRKLSLELIWLVSEKYKGKKQTHTHAVLGLSSRANYTDRAIAACRRSWCQLLRIEVPRG